MLIFSARVDIEVVKNYTMSLSNVFLQGLRTRQAKLKEQSRRQSERLGEK